MMLEARKVTGRPASIPEWAFGEVFRLRDLGYSRRCRFIKSLSFFSEVSVCVIGM